MNSFLCYEVPKIQQNTVSFESQFVNLCYWVLAHLTVVRVKIRVKTLGEKYAFCLCDCIQDKYL